MNANTSILAAWLSVIEYGNYKEVANPILHFTQVYWY